MKRKTPPTTVVSAVDPLEWTVAIGQEIPVAGHDSGHDPQSPLPDGLLLNREFTWLNFNRRVLVEAEQPHGRLLERLKFLAIVSSNLDEFFMKRMGGLKQLMASGSHKRSPDGRLPKNQYAQCRDMCLTIEEEKKGVFEALLQALKEKGIHLCEMADLSSKEQEELRGLFETNIFPLLTPQSIDPAHPFPFISNLSLNLLVVIRHPKRKELSLARVKLPTGNGISRFFPVGNHKFVSLESLVQSCLDMLFPEIQIVASYVFRITRNANTEKNEDQAEDLLEMIEAELRDRKFAQVVRLQIERSMPKDLVGFLSAELGLNEAMDIYHSPGMMAKRDLMEFLKLNRPELKDPPHSPIEHPRLVGATNIFHEIRRGGPLLLFHPFDSFTNSVERFLREASQDPKVRAIKMTLYRTSEESKIVPFLMQAAENGKQVSVVVELKARFDEAANIRWATRLEESGIHVSYGVVGYKTHCKVILVLRQDYSGLRCYCHFGTGNYHSGTARLYTDLGLLTCDEDLGRDATQLFNFLTTGLTPNRHYAKMLMAPANMKSTLLSLIKDEGARAANGQKAKILIKCNALEDPDVVQALYSASRQGAIVEAVIRDSCRLRPGIPGISETIRVRSVIGQFLEHSRIYAFHQGGNERWYIGSADAMMRNLEHRVETLVPVDDPLAKLECQAIMHMMLANEDHCWIMDSCGVFRRRKQQDQPLAPHPHSHWLTVAKERKQAAAKLKKIKSKSKKEFWYGYVAELNPNEPSS